MLKPKESGELRFEDEQLDGAFTVSNKELSFSRQNNILYLRLKDRRKNYFPSEGAMV
jgi:hypothetical protein